MSSRQEEKERRRKEREAAEQAAAAGAARRKRLAMVGGAALLVAVIAIAVVALAGGGGDDDGGGGGGDDPGIEAADAAPPTQNLDNNLQAAAEAAGCKATEIESEGDGHTSEAVKYEGNPPTSGDHDPVPAEDGDYSDGAPDIEQSVHALEHGRINVQYKKGTPPNQIAQLKFVALEESVKGENGYKTLFFENQTNMEPALAVTAWGRSLTCPAFNDRVFDAIRAFRTQNVDKGPEFIP
jgi:Protein of unknown function (DUF3105)